jgi:hypothetical protein
MAIVQAIVDDTINSEVGEITKREHDERHPSAATRAR